ncbi:PREDICTED: RNA polymerase II transcriptional coactivator KIWI [Tarenaya hassleriana]|uniref:RNA polymerase II transcriptional coactivator KIWI n=1 Tax=Tarenaya hassleriana TaxID=28532 RepID=UPI00053C318D|nr:PREDICTED: RNA polymerase II transcriptional coactivator KIWI [Tarenaya hassleriana]XP_010546309.1 PREDICTED: RNA polymerase II transcriptional coactivator KIWI [Tarenaya hassleriana]XP_010546310.1 PREDICTED: RNA polymerase II transcriptional coactivator KIWI [Tarenaya hassleriana]
MSSRGKRKEEDGRASDDDAEAHAPAKKVAKPADSSDESGDIVVCNISKNRRVTVRNWNGKIWIDIREFYDKDGKTLPGKKGISLSVDQWNILRDHVEEIDKAMADAS